MVKAILTHVVAVAHGVDVLEIPLVVHVHARAVDAVDVVELMLVQFYAGVVDLLKKLLRPSVDPAHQLGVVGNWTSFSHAAAVGGAREAELVVGRGSCNCRTGSSSSCLRWDQVGLAIRLVGLIEDEVLQRVVDLLVLGVLAAGACPDALHVCLAL